MVSGVFQAQCLKDGKLITEELGLNLEKVEPEMLDLCKRWVTISDDTVILDGTGGRKGIEEIDQDKVCYWIEHLIAIKSYAKGSWPSFLAGVCLLRGVISLVGGVKLLAEENKLPTSQPNVAEEGIVQCGCCDYTLCLCP
ncbi:hypothetical protein HPP92_014829 [Vanilla planifolia]|uniref:Uncharacterized protein n=1 Tax=Vanilla planifolia TaxID=51239 RepID=A0A835UT32_VANPL|nr:hypothetical protein HPP92_014829 [Vanilla planifolia]